MCQASIIVQTLAAMPAEQMQAVLSSHMADGLYRVLRMATRQFCKLIAGL